MIAERSKVTAEDVGTFVACGWSLWLGTAILLGGDARTVSDSYAVLRAVGMPWWLWGGIPVVVGSVLTVLTVWDRFHRWPRIAWTALVVGLGFGVLTLWVAVWLLGFLWAAVHYPNAALTTIPSYTSMLLLSAACSAGWLSRAILLRRAARIAEL